MSITDLASGFHEGATTGGVVGVYRGDTNVFTSLNLSWMRHGQCTCATASLV